MIKIKKIFSWINTLVPKTNIILFNSFPPYSDNAKAVYEYLVENEKEITQKYKLVWAQDTDEFQESKELKNNGRLVRKKSIKGIITFLRAKYVFATHGYFSNVYEGKEQVQINLWHGCGYKGVSKEETNYLGKYNIVTGEIYQSIHAKIFNIEKNSVIITGLPRNDKLFHPKQLPKIKELNYSENIKYIIWLPTYRKAAFRHKGIDGNEDEFGIAYLARKGLDDLDQELKKNNCKLIIKLHPMDALVVNTVKHYDNIIFLTNKVLENNHIDLYDILPWTDALISDYSSVIVDYLLLDKPIIILSGDKKEYSQNRGFVFEDIDSYLPGPIIESYDELVQGIINIDQIDIEWKDRRLELKDKMHLYQDDKSTERVVEYFLKNNEIKDM